MSAGSLPIGDASYPIPAGAVFVSPSGSDTASGSLAQPFRSIGRAISVAPAGGTVVIRGGTYHESLTIGSRQLTIQNYPGEAVWLDASERVDGWVRSGAVWTHAGWDHVFDHSPTLTAGAADGTAASWTFLNTAYPMAAHPDMLWVDGEELRQVSSRSSVLPGTFYYDEVAKSLVIGSDPTGREVEASSLQKALSVRVAGSVVRGIGMRRFATSMPQISSVTLERSNVLLENVLVSDCATGGIALTTSDITVRHVTIKGCGNSGIRGNYADRTMLDGLRVESNNDEHFNYSPLAGGVKFTRTQGITVRDSLITRNFGKGVWLDMSTYDSVLIGNDFIENDHYGVFLEVSAKSLVADNRFLRNASDGIKINNTQDVQVWNNTFVGNARPINIVQDARHAKDPEDAHNLDPRRPVPDPAMTWYVGPVSVKNNVISQPNASGNCLLCVEDFTRERTAEQMGIHADGNFYNRIVRPTWLTVWSRGNATSPLTFTTMDAFRAATGQESAGLMVEGRSIVQSDAGALVADLEGEGTAAAQTLPTAVAQVLGRDTGTRHMGAFFTRP